MDVWPVFMRSGCIILFITLSARAIPAAPSGDLAAADHLRLAKKYEAAIGAYRAVVAADPQSVQARYGLVRSLLGARRYEEARVTADQIGPIDSAFAQVARGDIDFRLAHFAQAAKAYASAVSIDPRNARGWFGAGRTLECESFFKSALDPLRKAFALDPDDPDIVRAYAHTLADHRQEAALLDRYRDDIGPYDAERATETAAEIALLRRLGDRKTYVLKSPYAKAEVPLEMLRPDPRTVRGWALKVSLDGAKPRKFLLDTGASGITLNRKLAEKLRLPRIHDLELKGVGDHAPTAGFVSMVDEARVGDVVFANCPVTVSDRNSVGGEDGIIGADAFEDFLITLDPARKRMILDPLPGRAQPPSGFEDRLPMPPESRFTTFARIGHLLLVSTRAAGQAPAMFLIDTGSMSTVVNTPLARALTSVDQVDANVNGLSGRVDHVYLASDVMLRFAGLRYPAERVVSFNLERMNDDIGTEVSGILGFELLSRLTTIIDYPDGVVKFIYRR
jgi:tetratricopeptide (TPR) repeat protein